MTASNTPTDLHVERDLAMGWLVLLSSSDDPYACYAQHVVAYVDRLRERIHELENKDRKIMQGHYGS